MLIDRSNDEPLSTELVPNDFSGVSQSASFYGNEASNASNTEPVIAYSGDDGTAKERGTARDCKGVDDITVDAKDGDQQNKRRRLCLDDLPRCHNMAHPKTDDQVLGQGARGAGARDTEGCAAFPGADQGQQGNTDSICNAEIIHGGNAQKDATRVIEDWKVSSGQVPRHTDIPEPLRRDTAKGNVVQGAERLDKGSRETEGRSTPSRAAYLAEGHTLLAGDEGSQEGGARLGEGSAVQDDVKYECNDMKYRGRPEVSHRVPSAEDAGPSTTGHRLRQSGEPQGAEGHTLRAEASRPREIALDSETSLAMDGMHSHRACIPLELHRALSQGDEGHTPRAEGKRLAELPRQAKNMQTQRKRRRAHLSSKGGHGLEESSRSTIHPSCHIGDAWASCSVLGAVVPACTFQEAQARRPAKSSEVTTTMLTNDAPT